MPARLPLYFRPLVLARPFPAAQLNGNQEGPLRHGRRPRPGLPPQRSAMEGAWAQARRLRPWNDVHWNAFAASGKGPGSPARTAAPPARIPADRGARAFACMLHFTDPAGRQGAGAPAAAGASLFIASHARFFGAGQRGLRHRRPGTGHRLVRRCRARRSGPHHRQGPLPGRTRRSHPVRRLARGRNRHALGAPGLHHRGQQIHDAGPDGRVARAAGAEAPHRGAPADRRSGAVRRAGRTRAAPRCRGRAGARGAGRVLGHGLCRRGGGEFHAARGHADRGVHARGRPHAHAVRRIARRTRAPPLHALHLPVDHPAAQGAGRAARSRLAGRRAAARGPQGLPGPARSASCAARWRTCASAAARPRW